MGPIPVLLGEYGFVFPELGVELKSSLRLSVRRYGVDFAATWTAKGRNTTDNANSVGAEVGIGSDGVSLSLDVTYLNQRFYLPIILSVTYDLEAALWTMVW
ncbi:hypothetical protein EW026_g2438 [Hermanssonia centrifuga]|uniref:Uncharacterized protein n=1 Tax=Hermanssonia centrifuga TaxID=98765 RepID=A0A4S4KPB8_9APHY|nr:hypothetical protein EW026_g2438 [Hermanssonia centrifuga]